MELPLEIQLEISDYLNPSDLGSLRQTRRHFQQFLDDSFMKKAILSRKHSMSPKSLQNLLELSRSRFGPHIKLLRLDPGSDETQHVELLKEAFLNLKTLDEVVVGDGGSQAEKLPSLFNDVVLSMELAKLRCKALKTSLKNDASFSSAFRPPDLKRSPDNTELQTPEYGRYVTIGSLEVLHLHVCGFQLLDANNFPAHTLFNGISGPVSLLRRATTLRNLKLIGNRDWLHDGLLFLPSDGRLFGSSEASLPEPNHLSYLRDLHLEGVAAKPSTLSYLVMKTSSTLLRLVLSSVTLIPDNSWVGDASDHSWDEESNDENWGEHMADVEILNLNANDSQLWTKLLLYLPPVEDLKIRFFSLSQLRQFEGNNQVFLYSAAGTWCRDSQQTWDSFLDEKILEISSRTGSYVTEEYQPLFAARSMAPAITPTEALDDGSEEQA